VRAGQCRVVTKCRLVRADRSIEVLQRHQRIAAVQVCSGELRCAGNGLIVELQRVLGTALVFGRVACGNERLRVG
jgi:hypothetical protein